MRGGAAAFGGAALALGGRSAWEAAAAPSPTAGSAAPAAPPDASGRATVEFRGARQPGVTTPPQAFGAFVAFDLVEGVDRDALVRLMRIWTDDVERLMAGEPGLADTEPELATVPASLTVTVGYGPGLFTAAGLEDRRPTWLRPLPAFGVDRLEDRWNGGDLVLQVCADDDTTVSHALRLLTKEARTFTTVRWVQRGFRGTPGARPPGTTMRNLMGQVDGTRNPDPGIDPDLVWHPDDGAGWLAGGTSMVVRRIAMDLDTWDELDRSGREQAVGRRLDTGAPLTGTHEHDEPDLAAKDANGLDVIGPFAHIRRARTDDAGQRFLRRAYNYDAPPSPGALSDSGLVFVTFQADVDRQFVPIQQRLDELDLLNEWTTPVGSAVFAVPPGARPGEYLGQVLLDG
ncbi:Dyp-type peroxidase [Cellulosimicrobium arenosum]|uniref:Dyp-type peroxidase n=1 Tax=Cellulosimicrobium arenosum TaxID=2708133 RepID=A0A927J0G4_9MICO|nr:Dyp-type peroxidase [Cellulosimicrobium arenosum]MBD8079614.1 Dyp-type peroxidase [Cellulosimicrobium arenosum]